MDRLGLFQAPLLTSGHRCTGAAALLGAAHCVLHVVTVLVTCAVAGVDWGVTAWVLDLMGLLASAFFAVQCRVSSNRTSADFRRGNEWIIAWAVMTAGSRIIDTLMLLGLVKWGAVYHTPTGAVFWSNALSEIVFGNAFTATALVGALTLRLCPEDADPSQAAYAPMAEEDLEGYDEL